MSQVGGSEGLTGRIEKKPLLYNTHASIIHNPKRVFCDQCQKLMWERNASKIKFVKAKNIKLVCM